MISLDKLNVLASAPANTVVGTLAVYDASRHRVSCNWGVCEEASGFFAASGSNLVTRWAAPITPGFYSITISTIGIGRHLAEAASFVIEVQ